MCVQVWESAGWRSCRLWAPASRCGTPPSCCWTRSPSPWTGRASCAGKGIKSVICSVINIHPFPYSRGGWELTTTASRTHSPRSRIWAKSSGTPTRWEVPRLASLIVWVCLGIKLIFVNFNHLSSNLFVLFCSRNKWTSCINTSSCGETLHWLLTLRSKYSLWPNKNQAQMCIWCNAKSLLMLREPEF